MLKTTKRVLSLLLVLMVLSCLLLESTPHTSAASVTYYQTSKSEVPIWSAASSSSTKIRTITTEGTVLRVVGSTTNSAGNLWYKLSDGYWVFSGNVTKHNHAYSGGICYGINCGYEYPYSVSSFSGTFVVTNTAGAKVWSRPYSNRSTHIRTDAYNKVLTVTGKTTNQEGNLWYKLSDGYWVYSGNVTQRFTVSYHANGGTFVPASQTVLNGSKLTIATYVPLRVGYIFQGWGTSASDTTVDYKPGYTYTFSKDMTLYAIWKVCSHDYASGICDICGYEYPLSITSVSKSFQVTNADGTTLYNRPYSGKSTVIAVKPKGTILSIVAQTTNQPGNLWYKTSDGYWTYSGNLTERLTVTFNANGGKNAPAAKTVLKNSSVTLPSSSPTRVGYVLRGWYTATSVPANTAYYAAGGNYKVTKNITLYAVWAKCTHAYSGGICKDCGYEYPLTVTAVASVPFQVTNTDGAPIMSRPYSNNATTVRTEKKGAVLTIIGKTTNQAGNLWYQVNDGNWVYSGNIAQRFTVTYNANGGSNAPAAQYFLKGKTLTLSSGKPIWPGYTFKGWGTSASDTTVDYKPGATYSTNKSITLYAIWSKCSHSKYSGGICTSCSYEYPLTISNHSAYYIVTNKDGAKNWSRPYSNNSNHISTSAYGAALVVTKKTVNQEGNTWYQLSNDNWVYSGNVSRAYKLTYNANGGSGAPSTVYKLAGTKFTLSSAKPTRSNYTFLGWATSSTGSVVYKAGASYTINGNATLYAVWAKNAAITTNPGNQILKSGATAKFSVGATGTGLSYQWQQRSTSNTNWTNAPYAGEFTATLNVPTTTALNGYQFRCKVTDKYGNVVYSKSATLNVLGITAQPKSIYIKSGNNVTFSVGAVGKNLTYQWQWRVNSSTSWASTTVSGNKTATITVPATAARNGYQYRCVVTDSAGNVVYSNAATLTVLGIKTQPVSVATKSGNTATFKVAATGKSLTYQWQWRANSSSTWAATTVSGNKTATISVPATVARNGYQYRCKITDSAGNVIYSNAVTLNVLGIKTQPTSVTAKVGNTATFKVVATGKSLTYQWQWRNGASGTWANTTVSGNKTATISVPVTTARNGYQYRCKITDSAGNVVYSYAVVLNVK